MKFLFVTLGHHPHPPGGAWRVSADLAAALAARGHEVGVVTGDDTGKLAATEVVDGVRLHRFRRAGGNFVTGWLADAAAAGRLVRQAAGSPGEPALVVLHHAYVARAATGSGQPVLAIFHGPWAEEFKSQRGADGMFNRLVTARLRAEERRGLRQARRIIVLSRHFASLLPRWHPGLVPPVEVVDGGVDLRRFEPAADRGAVRAELGLRPEEKLFLAVRRLDARMGLDVLVDAFARLPAEIPARLWIAGRGPQEAALRGQVAARGLAESARLLGFVEEEKLPRLYQAADFTVMPSLELEGFGLATAESLACGTPVLGSRAAATPELLEPLDRRLLFEAASVEALAAKLAEAAAGTAAFPDRARCRSYAEGRFTWDAMSRACEQAWENLAAPRHA
ncbi:MAG: glycosyltransferase [Limisphaerales bacterium]